MRWGGGRDAGRCGDGGRSEDEGVKYEIFKGGGTTDVLSFRKRRLVRR